MKVHIPFKSLSSPVHLLLTSRLSLDSISSANHIHSDVVLLKFVKKGKENNFNVSADFKWTNVDVATF